MVIDDKLRILAAIKQAWGDRVTTVFARQGQFALDPQAVVAYGAADVTIHHIAEILGYDQSRLINGGRRA